MCTSAGNYAWSFILGSYSCGTSEYVPCRGDSCPLGPHLRKLTAEAFRTTKATANRPIIGAMISVREQVFGLHQAAKGRDYRLESFLPKIRRPDPSLLLELNHLGTYRRLLIFTTSPRGRCLVRRFSTLVDAPCFSNVSCNTSCLPRL